MQYGKIAILADIGFLHTLIGALHTHLMVFYTLNIGFLPTFLCENNGFLPTTNTRE